MVSSIDQMPTAHRTSSVLKPFRSRTGKTGIAVRARTNLERLCEQYLKGRYRLEVIDLREHPALAREHGVLAVPLVVREAPVPIRKAIGDFSNVERTVAVLELAQPRAPYVHLAHSRENNDAS